MKSVNKKPQRFKSQIDDLKIKIQIAIARFGYDLDDEDHIDKLLEIADHSDNELRESNFGTDFISLALGLYEIMLSKNISSKNDEYLVDVLCKGNYLIGFVDAFPSAHINPYICPTCIVAEHLSRNGRAGATKKFAPMRKLEDWSVKKYNAGKWPSANKAAHDLRQEVIAHGKSIGAILSEQNAQRTIADWIRKSKKLSV